MCESGDNWIYREIFKATLYDIFSKYGINASKVIYQHDNDLKHTTKTMKG